MAERKRKSGEEELKHHFGKALIRQYFSFFLVSHQIHLKISGRQKFNTKCIYNGIGEMKSLPSTEIISEIKESWKLMIRK